MMTKKGGKRAKEIEALIALHGKTVKMAEAFGVKPMKDPPPSADVKYPMLSVRRSERLDVSISAARLTLFRSTNRKAASDRLVIERACEAISKFAAVLDEHAPGWRERLEGR